MPETTTAEVQAETAAAVAELGRAAIDRQLATGDVLDAKGWAALGAGSVVIGLGAVTNGEVVLLALAAFVYLGVAWSVIRTVRPREYKTPPSVEAAWGAYWSRPVVELHRALINSAAIARGENKKLLEDKRRWLQRALVALTLETFLLALAAVI